MQLHPEAAHLAELLRRLEEHLARHDAPDRAAVIGRCRACVEESDARGLHGFVALFGGMGSLNDLVLQRGGTPLTTENDQLQDMLGAAWMLATTLLREEAAHERPE